MCQFDDVAGGQSSVALTEVAAAGKSNVLVRSAFAKLSCDFLVTVKTSVDSCVHPGRAWWTVRCTGTPSDGPLRWSQSRQELQLGDDVLKSKVVIDERLPYEQEHMKFAEHAARGDHGIGISTCCDWKSKFAKLSSSLALNREAALERERGRIARDMHDELGQQLTALRWGIVSMRVEFGGTHPALPDRFQYLLDRSDKAMQLMRDVIASLRPAALDAGVVAALEWLIAEFRRDYGIACKLCVLCDDPDLSEDQAIVLVRIVQEALTNVARHAAASCVTVSLKRERRHWVLKVCDDGKGFDIATTSSKSFGLAGMQERATMLGGEVNVDSAPGRGTVITVHLPVSNYPEGF